MVSTPITPEQDSQVMTEGVRVWAEKISIPTYRVGEPDKNPMFLERRVYQGSSGVVYPHAVIDRIHDEKTDEVYTAVYLENAWIKVMILPEIGGRVQMALDKTNGHHFVYHNQVIKPALVGLAGPWISGGIEFNWPQHHRPSTFDALNWTIADNPDGSKTVWCGEIEKMFRTKGMHGFTIHPDRAWLRIDAKLYNRTSEPQTFLWWANPAVTVNDDYQSVFPQDVRAVMDHGKRDTSAFPIATGTYYKMNYAPGTDISRYKNIPVPTSYMAYHSDYNFLGCYDHGKRAGMLHVANHHVAPGKKQWTWGCGDFGKAWDRQLTDEDGPYIELMCGCYTDNQPDFSWMMPYEEKTFTQYFMPYQRIGAAKNASTEAAVNLEVEGGEARIGVYVTGPRTVTVHLTRDGDTVWEERRALVPETALLETVPVDPALPAHAFTLSVYGEDGRLLLDFAPPKPEAVEPPEPAKAARKPEEIETVEELYLNGLHLEQYRHATYDPQPYYEEALRRDPGDSRSNNALGLLLFRRGRFAEAEALFRAAVARLTLRNPNPYDGEPLFNLGLALKAQGRFDEAEAAFHKAVWNAAWQDAGYFELARISVRRGDWAEALDRLERGLIRNTRNHKARHLRTAVLRRLGRLDAAWAETEIELAVDPLDFGARNERALIARMRGETGAADAETLAGLWRRTPTAPREIALDYAHAGLFDEARELLAGLGDGARVMDLYYAAWIAGLAGDEVGARVLSERAAKADPGTDFPNELECIAALTAAIGRVPGDANAPYLLGNYLYHRRDHDGAIGLWEEARRRDPAFATPRRNLGLAYVNKRGDLAAALAEFEAAHRCAPDDARILFELDQLCRKMNVPPAERLRLLEARADLVAQRDDLAIERITLLNLTGRHEAALDALLGRIFHPWEGGEGKTTGQYIQALLALAKTALAEGRPADAIALLERAKVFPENLGEGKLAGAAENHIHYYLGLAHEALGGNAAAKAWYARASVGIAEPSSVMYYNDQPPDSIYYQGLALRALGRTGEADSRFRTLIEYGNANRDKDIVIDYFAVSLPDFLVFDEDLNKRNRIHCLYMAALGALGLGRKDEAADAAAAILALDAAHQGALVHRPR
jgi:tetratricopeptide (TPR) repeat protein